jgi:hypothetical protein
MASLRQCAIVAPITIVDVNMAITEVWDHIINESVNAIRLSSATMSWRCAHMKMACSGYGVGCMER